MARLSSVGGLGATSSVVAECCWRRDGRFITVPVTSGFHSRTAIRYLPRRALADRQRLWRHGCRTNDPRLIAVCVCVCVWSYRRDRCRFLRVNIVIRFDDVWLVSRRAVSLYSHVCQPRAFLGKHWRRSNEIAVNKTHMFWPCVQLDNAFSFYLAIK